MSTETEEKREKRQQEFQRKYRREIERAPSNPIPKVSAESNQETLFHYGGASSLVGMIKNNELHAYDLTTMSDTSELNHGEEILKKTVRALELPEFDDLRDAFLESLLEESNPLESHYHAFGFCLSERRDDLPQWRAYAQNGEGYCLGFDRERLRYRLGVEDDWRRPYDLLKVVYQPSKKEKLLTEVMEKVVELLSNIELQGADEKTIDQFVGLRVAFSYFLACTLPFLKSEAFREEQEWRVVSLIPSPMAAETRKSERNRANPIHVTNSGGHIRSYIKLEGLSEEAAKAVLPDRENPEESDYDDGGEVRNDLYDWGEKCQLPVTDLLAGPTSRFRQEEEMIQLLGKKYDVDIRPTQSQVSYLP